MKITTSTIGSAVVAFALALSGPVWAQADIDFGDDTSTWANDGECDDPRFAGEGTASVLSPNDQGRDASDCRAAYEAGTVTYVGDDGGVPAPEPAPVPATGGDIDFGDDSGAWANDGECDDPRFGGMLDSHEGADASDCRAAYEAGTTTFVGDDDTASAPEPAPAATGGDIDFGDDSGAWANDGECDDPRFGGMLDSHEGADASDCQAAYEAGTVSYLGEAAHETGDIDFGDNSGEWANDGECDDPRFSGSGMGLALDSHYMADAADCQAAYDAGTITLADESEGAPVSPDNGVDFGDDSGDYANDGECDDPRFSGSGMGVALDSHFMADASDCRAAYEAGTVTLGGDDDVRINFGDDSAATAFDGVCDDPRFQGRGAAPELYGYNALADATDCSAAYEAGTVRYDPQ